MKKSNGKIATPSKVEVTRTDKEVRCKMSFCEKEWNKYKKAMKELDKARIFD